MKREEKAVIRAAMRLFKNAYRERYPNRSGPHDVYEHDGMHGSHDNAFGKACAALSRRGKK